MKMHPIVKGNKFEGLPSTQICTISSSVFLSWEFDYYIIWKQSDYPFSFTWTENSKTNSKTQNCFFSYFLANQTCTLKKKFPFLTNNYHHKGKTKNKQTQKHRSGQIWIRAIDLVIQEHKDINLWRKLTVGKLWFSEPELHWGETHSLSLSLCVCSLRRDNGA